MPQTAGRSSRHAGILERLRRSPILNRAAAAARRTRRGPARWRSPAAASCDGGSGGSGGFGGGGGAMPHHRSSGRQDSRTNPKPAPNSRTFSTTTWRTSLSCTAISPACRTASRTSSAYRSSRRPDISCSSPSSCTPCASFRPTTVRISIPSIKLFQGDPVGHWEGDTLVVDTTNQDTQNLVRYLRQLQDRSSARDREVHPAGREHNRLRSDNHRPGHLHAALDGPLEHRPQPAKRPCPTVILTSRWNSAASKATKTCSTIQRIRAARLQRNVSSVRVTTELTKTGRYSSFCFISLCNFQLLL